MNVSFRIPKKVSQVTQTLENKGFEAYLIGGCVRDLLLGIKPKDWDITTNARPEEIISAFPATFYENNFGTVGIVNDTNDETTKVVEVTPYRLEAKYSNSRHPDAVTFSKKLDDDLKRRDFTINAIALKVGLKDKDHYKGQIIDPYKGQADIKDKVVRSVGNPGERFSEDALRLMRAVRISTELGFTINTETKSAIKAASYNLQKISKERVRDEFVRILMSSAPRYGICLLHELGLLTFTVPVLEKAIGVEQNKAHSYDVFEHTVRALDHGAKKNFPLEVRLAVLFHDIAKPETRKWSAEKKDWTFYGHDVVGARIAVKTLSELKFSRETIEKVTKLVRWHMFFSDTEQITLSAVRRMIRNVGPQNIWDLMNVRACDRIGMGRPKESPYRLRKYKSMIEEALHDPISVSMLKVDGGRIMELTGLTPGPKIGFILHALLEEVLDEPGKNNATFLEKRLSELAKMPDDELKNIGQSGKKKREEEEDGILKEIRKKYWVN